jgi:hypothetical protein
MRHVLVGRPAAAERGATGNSIHRSQPESLVALVHCGNGQAEHRIPRSEQRSWQDRGIRQAEAARFAHAAGPFVARLGPHRSDS